ncbi:protein FD-like [Trifolium pratense]|uniref:protein FD-like n=1 Tax=Trifolium pratense TaxID=57577 RepID=UPI001E695C4D|nr:protein FD-like [Trifolium pratense]
MEEVWKDINLSSLNDQNTRPMLNTRSTFGGGVILQDFLTRPLNIDPPKSLDYSSNNSSSSVASDQNNTNNGSFYCSATPPPLVTALSLNSHPDFHFDPLIRQNKNNNSQLLLQQQQNVAACFVNPSSYEQNVGVGSNSFTCFGKRFGEPEISPGERRNNRMIKNRESAARSRARKQAYTTELEQKVQLLQEENARLKRQQKELFEAEIGVQQKKNSISRTSSF